MRLLKISNILLEIYKLHYHIKYVNTSFELETLNLLKFLKITKFILEFVIIKIIYNVSHRIM